MLIQKNAQVSSLTAKQVTLTLETGQQLQIPREELEPIVALETPYVVQIMPQAEALLEREALARTLLNQLLEDETSG